VGTTRNRLGRKLAEISGLALDEDIMVCFSPERVSSGTVFQDLGRYPKLIGAIGPKSQEIASSFYRSVLGFDNQDESSLPNSIWVLENCESAELAKLAETTYRDVNIALANQFAIYGDRLGLNIHEIISACNSQPFSHIHSPGIAVGGHCIPVYPKMYLEGDPGAEIVSVARKLNEGIPMYAVERIQSGLGLKNLLGLRTVILGLAYREGVKEDAFSGDYQLKHALESAGSKVLILDPLYTRDELIQRGFDAFTVGDQADILVLHTYDETYGAFSESDFPGLRLVFDGRNKLKETQFGDIPVFGLGRGPSESASG
jgi:nucleotide sugar dehydrogenase